MSAVFHLLEFEAEGQSACSETGLLLMRLWASEILVPEIVGVSAKVMTRTGGERELVEPDRARLLNSARAAECDRIRLRGKTSPEGVDMTR